MGRRRRGINKTDVRQIIELAEKLSHLPELQRVEVVFRTINLNRIIPRVPKPKLPKPTIEKPDPHVIVNDTTNLQELFSIEFETPMSSDQFPEIEDKEMWSRQVKQLFGVMGHYEFTDGTIRIGEMIRGEFKVWVEHRKWQAAIAAANSMLAELYPKSHTMQGSS